MMSLDDGNARTVLEEFLHLPVGSADGVLAKFAALPDAEARGEGLDRFVYVPGTRADRVLLVAHADTVWDHLWRPACSPELSSSFRFDGGDGRYHSTNPACGLGADDRAGCAMLWRLKDLGHSLLVTNGEEKGQRGATFLVTECPDLAAEIRASHRFVVAFDRRNVHEIKTYDVGTESFRRYVEASLGEPIHHVGDPGRSDIIVLCGSRGVPADRSTPCGVNLSIGCHDEHRPSCGERGGLSENLVLAEWLDMLRRARAWLSGGDLPAHRNPSVAMLEAMRKKYRQMAADLMLAEGAFDVDLSLEGRKEDPE